MKTTWQEVIEKAPKGATGVIVAEFETDQTDSMTDYYATRTEKTVVIGYRFTKLESFKALRKAAATFEPTKHLGPGCDVYSPRVVLRDDATGNGASYWKGSYSHWHRELVDGQTFTTLAQAEAFVAEKGEPYSITFHGEQVVRFGWDIAKESIEHRENYSMGSGNYLKGGIGYSTGWTVSSQKFTCRVGGQDVPAFYKQGDVEISDALVGAVSFEGPGKLRLVAVAS